MDQQLRELGAHLEVPGSSPSTQMVARTTCNSIPRDPMPSSDL